ncbi:MAG: FAD:protein FMN transferase, partial [Chitinophagaceae bacterium]
VFNIIVYSTDSLSAGEAAAHCYRMIDTLNEIYSDYLPASELNRLCARSGSKDWVNVSAPLFDILQVAYHASEISGGRFDVTIGPLVRLWRRARKDRILPNKDSLRAAKRLVGYRKIQFDTIRRTIRLTKTGMQLDLGGIAQGETAQRVYERLQAMGFPFSLVDAAGDIVAGGTPAGIDGWHVGVNMPQSESLMNRQLCLSNKAVTTSGDMYQYVELAGKRYSHIINPRTGYALTQSRNVTVIAGKGVDADWLTKACSMLPVSSALRLIKKFPSTEVQIALLESGKPTFYRSSGFESYFKN